MANEKKLIIIDSSALLYRAFHALPPLTNKNGQATGAAYGFLLILFKAIKDLRANYIVACFDTPKPTFRHEKFDDYKAHRQKTPDDIISQIPIIKEGLKSFKIPIFKKKGFDEKIKVYTLGKGIKDAVLYDENKVVERFGVSPLQMNDFKALTGDSSDNIPGVPGIGKTTAADLIQRFGSVKNLYDELSTDTAVVKPKIKEALKQNKESAFLSLQLVETVKDLELDFNLENCKFTTFDQEKVKTIFNNMGFASLIDRLPSLVFD